MTKVLLFFVTIWMLTFDIVEQATFECNFQNNSWVILGSIYNCYITKSTTISSLDESFVESAIGTHQYGLNNDNIHGLWITVGITPYFPRGWEKIFKNLIGLHNCGTQLKEIHQSDLKPFPKLRELFFHGNLIEILEVGLFEFNPDLEYLCLAENKISHIDSKTFDNLAKLSKLYLQSNLCISLNTVSSNLQSIIAASKTQCINSAYSDLDQKFMKLDQESKSLDSWTLNEKIENLEKDLKNSKFPNFFQKKLQNLKALQNSVPETTTIKPSEETCTSLKSKFINLSLNLKNWIDDVSNATGNDTQTCEYNEVRSSVDNILLMSNESFTDIHDSVGKIQDSVGKIQDSYSKQKEIVLKIDEQLLNLDEKISKLDENMQHFNTKFQDLEETINDKIELEVKAAHVSIIRATNKAIEKIEKKIMEKLDKIINAKKTTDDY